MTLNEIRESDKLFLVPSDIAKLVGCDAQSIRYMAKTAPKSLGFPVCIVGTRTRIPRIPFLRFLGVEEEV